MLSPLTAVQTVLCGLLLIVLTHNSFAAHAILNHIVR